MPYVPEKLINSELFCNCAGDFAGWRSLTMNNEIDDDGKEAMGMSGEVIIVKVLNWAKRNISPTTD